MWIDDQVLTACDQAIAIKCWIPEKPIVVLGRANRIEKEVQVRACIKAGIPMVKRLGGGGTVVLHEGCVIVSLGLWVKDFYANDRYFSGLNSSVIDCLQHTLPSVNFAQRGHSDIVSGDRKCAGTSLFRSRNYLLYQASLLVDMRLNLIEFCLNHPTLEPDYRLGRQHKDFLVDLKSLGGGDSDLWCEALNKGLQPALLKYLKADLIEPQVAQIPHIKSRIGEQWLRQEEIDTAGNPGSE